MLHAKRPQMPEGRLVEHLVRPRVADHRCHAGVAHLDYPNGGSNLILIVFPNKGKMKPSRQFSGFAPPPSTQFLEAETHLGTNARWLPLSATFRGWRGLDRLPRPSTSSNPWLSLDVEDGSSKPCKQCNHLRSDNAAGRAAIQPSPWFCLPRRHRCRALGLRLRHPALTSAMIFME